MRSISTKKLLAVLFIFSAIFALFVITVSAETYGSISYNIIEPEDGEDFESYIEISGYSVDDELDNIVVDIPSEIDKIPVKAIRESAFKNKSSIAEVILPDSVTLIENSAFYNCADLKIMVIPASVKLIGDSAFQNCASLEYVIMENGGVEEIGDIAFKNCSSLIAVNLNDGLKVIGNGAFFNCEALKMVNVPPSVESIGSLALGYVQDGDGEKQVEGFKRIESDCPENGHDVEWTLVRTASETYDGLEAAACKKCGTVLTKTNTDIPEEKKSASIYVFLGIVVAAVIVLVILLVNYVKKSKARRERAIADYKAGKPLETEAERIEYLKKVEEKERKKRAKQEEKLKKEQEIQG